MKNDLFRMPNTVADPQSRRIVTVALLSLVMFAIWFVQAGRTAGKKPPIPTYRVKVEFGDRPGDRVLSVGGSTYIDGEMNASGQIVDATIGSSTGGLDLTTLYCTTSKGKTTCFSLGRYHFFDFSDPVMLRNPLPTNNGWANCTIAAGAGFLTDPLSADGVTRLPNGFRDLMNSLGEQRLAAMKVNFRDSTGSSAAGSTFTLRFTPNFYSESNYLLATYKGGFLSCGGVNNTPCASWTVEAVNDTVAPEWQRQCKVSSLQDIAALPNGDNSIYYGTFHMPFKITITVLPNQ